MPVISIIMPVYNVAQYLRECIDSIFAQTFTDWEMIAVDDGSADESAAILKEYAQNDKRLKILQQSNKGAAAARNYGMQYASGKYLMFLDSDDIFEPDMLECMKKEAERTDAEIVFSNYDAFDTSTQKKLYEENYSDFCKNIKMPFSFLEQRNNITICDIAHVPWIYFYSAEYIQKTGMYFQEIPRNNDMYFVLMVLLSADKVSFVDRVFVHYRKGTNISLQDHTDKSPLCFYEALSALQKKLIEKGLFEPVKKDFAKFALGTCIYNLELKKNPEVFSFLYRELKDRIFPDFEFGKYEFCIDNELKTTYQWILQHEPDCIAFWKAKYVREREKFLKKSDEVDKLEVIQERYDDLIHSGSYRLAQFFSKILHWIKH